MLLRNLIRFNCWVLIAIVSSACSIVNSDIAVDSDLEKSDLKTKLTYGAVILQPTSEYAIIPLGFTVNDSYKRLWSDGGNSLDGSRSQMSELRNFVATNLIFHHQKNDATHLLLDRKAIISQFDYLNPNLINDNNKSSCYAEDKASLVSQLFIYQIIEKDTSEDGKLDAKDANRGYISNLSGKDLRPITPEKTTLVQWQCDLERNQIILFVREDFNQNKHYASIDPLVPYLYNLTNKELLRIIPKETSLSKWKIDFDLAQIFLEIKQDTNRDRQFTDEDESTILKFDLTRRSETKEITNEEIRFQIKSLNSK